MLDDIMDNEKYTIAQKLYEFYVMNDKYLAVQMPDGRYIPKRITCTPLLIYDMLNKGASFGMYQQQYRRSWIKWICLDFDCKEGGQLEGLVEKYVIPAAKRLEQLGIHYLAEFSGRRGVHLWIHTKGMITKSQGYSMIEELTGAYRLKLSADTKYGLDIFPAVAGGGMKLGKQVKLPLSVHRKGGRSFFIPDVINVKVDDWIHLPEQLDFWKIQDDILETYIPNDLEYLWKCLNISPEKEESDKGLLYKKEYLVANRVFSLEEIRSCCKESSVLYVIMKRAEEGNLKYLDRLVLVGCFRNFSNGALLWDILKQQHNFKEDITRQYLDKLKNRYYPITMRYLYDLYGQKLEENIDPQITLAEYIADRLDISIEKIQQKEVLSQKKVEKDIKYFQMIQKKELQYMKYDDEVLSVDDYLELSGLCQFDLLSIKRQFEAVIEGNITEHDLPVKYTMYERMEEGKNEPRILVSLCPYDRVLTTALIYELIENMGQRFHSYSYNLNYFYDAGSVFMPWYDSWKRFQQDVENYLFLDFFSENGIIKLDLTKFYDSIYIHALFRQIQEQGNQTENEEKKKRIDAILRYLGNYTEKLMLQMKGNIRGVPQGPAYARVFAELFLTAVLDSFCRKYHYTTETCRIMRYVDDMFIVYRGIDGNQLLNRFSEYIFARGLEINRSKTLIYECIGDMSEREKESLFENGAANYEMKSIQGMELEDEELQQENIRLFEKYLHRKGSWSIKDANFILNRYLDPIFVDEYLNKYVITLVKQKVGRGSIYKRLYEELFKRDEWLEKFFAMELYRQIPQNTVNFKNFMSVCYFSVSRIKILNAHIKDNFVEWLNIISEGCMEEKGTVGAIIGLMGGKYELKHWN